MPDKGAGILIPIFSLRSKEGFGIGEFSDLILLSDLAKKSGFSLIQLLPFFDTSITKTWKDSYCYSALSMFALHPIYLRIEKAFLKIPNKILSEINEKKEKFNQLKEVDYEEVYKEKMDLCKRLYALEKKSHTYELFVKENTSWLPAYAAFSVLRDSFGSSDFSTWPECNLGTKEVVDQICAPSSKYYQEVSFYYFLQFHLHQQLMEAITHAKEKGISFKGDFPVGVHAHSVETWMSPELFTLEKRIGAPPDYFNAKGQNWELPAYNWKEMKESSYLWFVKRLKHIEQYCQLIRIDHILGYFRFWEIPEKCARGALGYFQPSFAISLSELPEEMQQNITRYCHPFITDTILEEHFEERKHWITEFFFEKNEIGQYRFKEFFQNQQAIEQSQNISTKEKNSLHELYENVILIPDIAKKNTFYPRIGLENTSSFSLLDQDKKEYCKTLYNVYFSTQEEALWKEEGLEKLTCFKENTSMEICAEDLGMIPKCTAEVLNKLRFLRLHVQRMPKKESEEFSIPSEYEYLSVCSPSNHDTSTLRMWWQEDEQRTQRFYQTILKQHGQAPSELSEFLCEMIIQMHLESGAKWAIFLMQDLLAMSSTLKRKEAEKERINDPSIHAFYWRWRLHRPLEELLEEDFFSSFLHGLLLKTGRTGGITCI